MHFYCFGVGLGFFVVAGVLVGWMFFLLAMRSNRLTVNSLKITPQEYSKEGKDGTYLAPTLNCVDHGAVTELLSSNIK